MKATPKRATALARPASADGQSHQWLLLTHLIPPEPSYLRVKVRRQLESLGAVPLKNSVYLLPPSDETREDFEWLCREIERNGGETTLCAATFLDEATDTKLLATFRAAREADYASIEQAARALFRQSEEERMKEHKRTAQSGKLRRRLDAVTAIDFFEAPGREAAQRAIAEVELLMHEERAPRSSAVPRAAERPSGRTWVTRQGVKVDRMASAWLIGRFIDRNARFKFVPARGYRPEKDELRFDMFDGDFTHEGDHCTFETLLQRFGLDEAALRALGEIVHDIDCKDEKFGRAEVSGVASFVDGITRVCESDEQRIERGTALFDGLYEHFRAGPR